MVNNRIGVRIDERRLKPDMDLLEQYVAYSAELLRLSLLGVAGYAFLLKELVYSQSANKDFAFRLTQNRWSLIGGVISFGISAAFALQHRIFATDVVACMLDHLRYRAVNNQASAEKQASEARSNLKWSGRLLVLSALFLGFGAAAVVYTFVRVLWS
jgi:hypothetical protein